MSDPQSYSSPFSQRYASKEMSYLFSSYNKHLLWRKLWVALAISQKHLGLAISDEQIKELEKHLPHIDFEKAHSYEKKFKHDVMAHIHAYGDLCPQARSIIHLGATSCFVTDNADLIIFKEALDLVRKKVITVLRQLELFARTYSDLPTLGFTHFQSAQPTTVGKRACSWIQDLLMDLQDINYAFTNIKFLGVKGATGTQASFLNLFNHDETKVKELDILVAQKMGFESVYSIATQTYPRKQDLRVFNALNGLAATAYKFASDLRLLAHLKEIEEPFSESQIGSSAMPYKRNPMKAERICALARFLMSLADNPAQTASHQWLERTLDDSANRRLYISEAFLCIDAILNLMIEVTKNLVVYPKVISSHLKKELPFLATENILMHAVKKGEDRQVLHEKLRQYTQEAARQIKEEGLEGNLLQDLLQDPSFHLSEAVLNAILDPKHFIGRASSQCLEFLDKELVPMLKLYAHEPSLDARVEI